MLYTIMKHIKNFFPDRGYSDIYTISSGSINLPFLLGGQYFLIEGSVFNDGVYKYDEHLELTDETFKGTITALKPSKDFLSLVSEIEAYVSNNDQNSPYVSESFGGYSYTKATANGAPVTWKNVFASRLNEWRKL